MNNLYFHFLRIILMILYFYFILRKDKNKVSKLFSIVISTLLWISYYLESLIVKSSAITSSIKVVITIIWLINSLVMISQLEKSK